MPRRTRAQILRGRNRLTSELPLHPAQLFRIARLCEIFDCDPSTLWRMRKRGLLPEFVEIGGIRGLTGQQLQQVLQQRRRRGGQS